MNRLESMSVFISVVEAGSLSAVSRKLGMPLATVSRKISELEDHLNARLINRTTRSLELTEAGRIYLNACERILEEIAEAERMASGEYRAPKGKLFVTAPTVFGRLHILPLVADFLKAYPDIDVHLMLTDRKVDLIDEHQDVAIRIGELPDSTMLAIRGGLIRKVVCGSPAYFKKNGIPKKPKDLSNHECISIQSLVPPDHWIFQKNKLNISVSIHSRLVVSTVEAGLDAAVAGVGVTMALSYQIEKLEKEGKIKTILEDYESETLPVHLLHVAGGVVPQKLRAFLDFVSPRLKKTLHH